MTDTDETGAPDSAEVIAAETLIGDIRDAVLARVRTLPEIWAKLPEARQQAEVEACTRLARDLVLRSVEIVHAAGAPSLRMKVAGVGFKKDLTCSLVGFMQDANRHLLADQVGDEVTVVIAGAAEFEGERAPAETDPDQPGLPVFDGSAAGERVAAETAAPEDKPKRRGRRKKAGDDGPAPARVDQSKIFNRGKDGAQT